MARKRPVRPGPWFRIAVVSMIAALVLAACGEGDDGEPTEPASAPDAEEAADEEPVDAGGDETIVIGVAMKTQLQPRWDFDVQAMQQRAEELGAELIVQWANDDPDTQASQVENLLSQGVDALIITPVDGIAAGSSAQAAKAEGIPVVSYDIGIENTEVDYFVVRDNDMVGVLQAEAALEFAPVGKYALIEGDAANDVAQAISANHQSTLEGTDVEIVYNDFTANWDPQSALETAENLLSVHDDEVVAFLTANDGMAGGVIQALDARGLTGEVFVSGLDADVANLGFIRDGAQTMSVWTKIDEQGALAVEAAVGLVRGDPPAADDTIDNGLMEVPALLAPVFAVNAENLCEFVTEIAPAGWVTVEDVFDDPDDCA